jgi:hypothetical protein
VDTLAAIVGSVTAVSLFNALNPHYPSLFALSPVPGLIAAGLIPSRSRKSTAN